MLPCGLRFPTLREKISLPQARKARNIGFILTSTQILACCKLKFAILLQIKINLEQTKLNLCQINFLVGHKLVKRTI